MTKFLNKIKENKTYYYLILILISLIVSIPLIKFQVKISDDGFIHILRVIGIDNILKLKEFPPYIEPNYCNNWGYAINLFYPPLVTYIPLLFKFISNSYCTAIKLYTLTTILISAFTMYKCTKEITQSKETALLSGVLYTIFPYRLETIYDRFAIGEFSAYMFLPLVFLGLYNLINREGKKHYYISIGAIGLILTHTITTEYTALFCVIYMLFNLKKLKNKQIIKKLIINTAIILGVTAFFTIPMLEHKILGNYTIFNAEKMLSTGKDVQSQTIKIWELFVDKQEDYVSFKIGTPVILLLLLSCIGYKNTKQKEEYTIFMFFAAISIIMCLNIFLWILVPNFLCTLQYPWRMLEFFGFFSSIICAINAYAIIKKITVKKQPIALIYIIIAILILGAPTIARYKVKPEDASQDKQYEKSIKENMKISHFSINREYLPLNACEKQKTYMLERNDSIYILKGNCTIENEKKENLKLDFNIKNVQEGTVLELPYLYYLGYKATIQEENKKNYEIKTTESENGFVEIAIEDNIKNATIHVEYKGTTLEKVSYIISAISTIAFVIYIFLSKKGEKIER